MPHSKLPSLGYTLYKSPIFLTGASTLLRTLTAPLACPSAAGLQGLLTDFSLLSSVRDVISESIEMSSPWSEIAGCAVDLAMWEAEAKGSQGPNGQGSESFSKI